jgi:hypothetical protein
LGGSPVLVLVDLGRSSPVPPPAPKHGLCVSGPAYRVPQSIANCKFFFSIQTLRELCTVNDSCVWLCGIAMHRRDLKNLLRVTAGIEISLPALVCTSRYTGKTQSSNLEPVPQALPPIPSKSLHYLCLQGISCLALAP